MKRLISLILIALCLFAVCSCSSEADTSSANKITFGEKYLCADDFKDPLEEREYYIIYDDGYMEYYRNDISEYDDYDYHFTVRYKYEVVDEGTLTYFYDSIEIHDGDNKTNENDKIIQNGILFFSENVLFTQSGNNYILESYADEELPNFGK